MGFEDNPANDDEHLYCKNEIHRLEAELAGLREEALWIRRKLELPDDTEFLSGKQSLAGQMHVVCSDAFGYRTYIKAYKCDDKQGEIARLTVRNAELVEVLEAASLLIHGLDTCPENIDSHVFERLEAAIVKARKQ